MYLVYIELFLLVSDNSVPSDNLYLDLILKSNPLDKTSQKYIQLVSRFPQNNMFQLDIRIVLLDLDNSTQLYMIVWFRSTI